VTDIVPHWASYETYVIKRSIAMFSGHGMASCG
jgi:hypothetical protein